MTRRVRRSRNAREWGSGYEMLLSHGHDFFNELDHTPTRTQLRSAWKDLGAKLLFEMANTHPGMRPWGWWEFDSDTPRDPQRDQADQLRQMGLLSDDEERVLRLRATQTPSAT